MPIHKFIKNIHSLPEFVRKFLAVCVLLLAVGMLLVGWNRSIQSRLGDLTEESTFAIAIPAKQNLATAEPEKVAIVRPRSPQGEIPSGIALNPPAEPVAARTISPTAGITESFKGISKLFIKNPSSGSEIAATAPAKKLIFSEWFSELGDKVEGGVAGMAKAMGNAWEFLREEIR